MKHSIKWQVTAVFAGLLIVLILALMMINLRFLEPYYINNKKEAFIEMYQELNAAVEAGTIEEEEVSTQLAHLAEENNISFLISDQTSEKVFTNVYNPELLRNQMVGYLLNQAQKRGEVLETTDDYEISQSYDPWNQKEYIDMWGQMGEDNQFLLRSPVEGIRESAEISNRFLIYIGSVLGILALVLVWYFSKRMTKPLLELTALSDRMANLDFEAKYTSGGKNEIGELGANFNRMSEKLEQMRNEFLGNVSHELKTPIALIQGYAEGLKEGISDDPESRQFYCDVIMDEAAKMNQMVKNLLTLNQLEFGDEDIVFERFDIAELIRGVLQSMEIMAAQEEAQVIFRQEEPVYVWADEFKVEQVLRNYISNAFHHLSGEKVIEVKVVTEAEKARVTVFNTGLPIPEEDLTHIWDKFYKVDKAHTREYGGNGIGLSIVKAIMESLHQGYGVNNYDNGVEFWFELDIK